MSATGLFVLVTWCWLALMTGAIAQAKKQPAGGWFAMSLVLGPLAALLLWSISEKDQGTGP